MMWQFLSNLRWQDGVDIILVAIIIYQVVLVLRGTQAIPVLAGLFLLFIAYVVARQLEFFTLEWLLDIIVKSFVLIVIILFQADIRRFLSRMGKKALAPGGLQAPLTVEEVCDAADTMAGSPHRRPHRHGALYRPVGFSRTSHQAGRPGHQGVAGDARSGPTPPPMTAPSFSRGTGPWPPAV